MSTKICNICKLPIHKANVKKVSKSCFHYLCWERFDKDINEVLEKGLKKLKEKSKWKNIIKAIIISLILNFFIWWVLLEIIRRITNSWR